ncbi:MAG: ABC transporter ATP-binding protein [Caldimonas sp.]
MSTPPALEVRGLRKSFGGLVATRDVDLVVEAGHIHAVIGPNGAGKTTLISLLAGSLAADAGRIALFGSPIASRSQEARVNAGLVRSFQITSVFSALTVLDNLVVAVQRDVGPWWSMFRSAVRDRTVRDRAAAIAARVWLGQSLDAAAASLTHAARRRLDVGLALATEPRMILLDEPMAGMGHEESADMVTLIRSLRTDATVLLVEHDMDAVFSLVDRVTVLVEGAILATDTVEAIRESPEVRAAYLGEEEAG